MNTLKSIPVYLLVVSVPVMLILILSPTLDEPFGYEDTAGQIGSAGWWLCVTSLVCTALVALGIRNLFVLALGLGAALAGLGMILWWTP